MNVFAGSLHCCYLTLVAISHFHTDEEESQDLVHQVSWYTACDQRDCVKQDQWIMSLGYCSLSASIKEPLYNAFMSGQHANRPVLTSTSMWCNNMKSRCSERCLYWKFSTQWLSVFPSAVAQVDGWDVSQEPGRGGGEAEQQSARIQETTVPGQLWICLLKFGSISFPSPSSSVQETKNSRVQQQWGCKCFSVNI